MKRFLMFLFACLLLVGCGAPPDHYSVRIESSRPWIVTFAMDAWAQKVPVHFELTDGPADIAVIDTPLAVIDSVPDSKGDAWGITNEGQGHCYIGQELSDPDFLLVTTHELGHAMGLHHLGPGNLMSPGGPDAVSKEITEADVAQWEETR